MKYCSNQKTELISITNKFKFKFKFFIDMKSNKGLSSATIQSTDIHNA
jgi:hypothetical protein